jgi:hypothetical protein
MPDTTTWTRPAGATSSGSISPQTPMSTPSPMPPAPTTSASSPRPPSSSTPQRLPPPSASPSACTPHRPHRSRLPPGRVSFLWDRATRLNRAKPVAASSTAGDSPANTRVLPCG